MVRPVFRAPGGWMRGPWHKPPARITTPRASFGSGSSICPYPELAHPSPRGMRGGAGRRHHGAGRDRWRPSRPGAACVKRQVGRLSVVQKCRAGAGSPTAPADAAATTALYRCSEPAAAAPPGADAHRHTPCTPRPAPSAPARWRRRCLHSAHWPRCGHSCPRPRVAT